jgi:hypothetical protein
MSPEQLAGQPVDTRSDIYSSALLLFEALTGKLPYASGKSLTDLCPDATQPFAELLEQCLSADPADRPPSAVEVYLRLQELGKASGILLLPPGAMDKLVAARKSEAPTEPYHHGSSRRWLIGAAAVAAIATATGVWWWLSDPTPETGAASLMGVRIGDPVNEAQAKIGASAIYQGNPWSKENAADLGHSLARDDLKLPAPSLLEVATRWSADGRSCVLSHQEKVVAVVTSSSAGGTGRGVRVGNDVKRLYRLYPESADEHGTETKSGTRVQVRRYDALGVAFEIKGTTVHRITLYPPKAP